MHRARRRPFAAAPVLAALLSVAVGCSNAPPPPLVPRPPKNSTPAPTAPMQNEVVVGVDHLEGGFNPHTLADLSPTSATLSSLMLPSAFRPGPDGHLRLDGTLMDSAEVVPDAPKFTVRYQIKTEAAWSDGAPIAAEDFVYLWDELRSQPGVADPAGYQLIDDVASRSGGKTVEVTFSRPYPGWRSLFTNLLPAHLLKDDPHGWATALDDGYPASGGPFWIRQIDRERGEIVLERNERYWGPPAVSDRIVLRASDQSGQLAALRSGDSHLAVFSADAATMRSLRQLGDSVKLTTVPRPATMQVLLRPNSSQLADERVRRAVAAALDRQQLIDVGTRGGPAAKLPAEAQVLAPSEPGYAPTEPAGDQHSDSDRVDRLLTEAGYQHIGGGWVRNGRELNLLIAAPFEHAPYVRIAETAARQLREQGIQATVETPTGDSLFGEMLPTSPVAGKPGSTDTVDMAVTPRPAGGDPAAMMASSFGCAGYDSENEEPFPYNASGFCDQLLQPAIDAALTGRIPFAQASARVESELWSQAIAVPLYQQAQVMAVRRDVTGVAPGNGFAGPFSTAARWRGTPTATDDY